MAPHGTPMACHPAHVAQHVAMHSSCPSARWLEIIAPSLGRERGEVVALSAGANKGFGVASLLHRYGHLRNVTNGEWFKALGRHVT